MFNITSVLADAWSDGAEVAVMQVIIVTVMTAAAFVVIDTG